MGETYHVIGIEIFHDTSQGLLGLSHKAYTNKVLERFKVDTYLASLVPIQKGDKISLMQCPKNDLEWKQMKNTDSLQTLHVTITIPPKLLKFNEHKFASQLTYINQVN